MRIRLLAVAAFLVFGLSPGTRAAEGAAPAGGEEPGILAGLMGPDGLMDYESPNVKQELLNAKTLKISYVSKDPEYGYSYGKPIMVGHGKDLSEGTLNEQRYLDALAGPKGEPISYKRVGDGPHFRTTNGAPKGVAVLDMYEVTYLGLEEPIVLYLNMYDSDTLRVPVGLTLRFAPVPRQ